MGKLYSPFIASLIFRQSKGKSITAHVVFVYCTIATLTLFFVFHAFTVYVWMLLFFVWYGFEINVTEEYEWLLLSPLVMLHQSSVASTGYLLLSPAAQFVSVKYDGATEQHMCSARHFPGKKNSEKYIDRYDLSRLTAMCGISLKLWDVCLLQTRQSVWHHVSKKEPRESVRSHIRRRKWLGAQWDSTFSAHSPHRFP